MGISSILLCAACSEQKASVEAESSEPEVTNQQEENNGLPLACQDEVTLQTVREIILENAAKTAKNEEQKEFISQTKITFQNIVIEDQATESNPVNSCSADVDIEFPFATGSEKSQVLADMAIASAMIHFKPELSGRIAYQSKFAFNDGQKNNYFTLANADTYANSVQIFTRLFATYKDGYSIVSGKINKQVPETTKVKGSESSQSSKKAVAEKEIESTGVQWSRAPHPSYSQADLEGEPRSMLVAVGADENGVITSVDVLKSTGLPELDKKVINSVYQAKFKPYKVNGELLSIQTDIPFDLN